MATDPSVSRGRDARLLEMLEQSLAIQAPELRLSLDRACSLVAEVLGADKVDVFLYQAESDSLVAMGTSDTPMDRWQHQLGRHRQPLVNGGPAALVFQTGASRLTGRVDQDPAEIRGAVEALGVRSEIDVPIEVDGTRRGVVRAATSEPDRFTVRDLRFLEAVAGWLWGTLRLTSAG